MDEGERVTLPELREKLRRNGDYYNHGSVEPALRALCGSGSVMHTRKQAGDTFTKPHPPELADRRRVVAADRVPSAPQRARGRAWRPMPRD